MRIWSLHPRLLDTKGLIALWRESLLAKHVLEGKTKGYKHHPQLSRFRMSDFPLDAINKYLETVWNEAERRGFHFDQTKFRAVSREIHLSVSNGQAEFEFEHLLKKLKERDPLKFIEVNNVKMILHPLFILTEGEIEDWERI